MTDHGRRRFQWQHPTLDAFAKAGTPEGLTELRKEHVVSLPETRPAIPGATGRIYYSWEVQRQRNGLWSRAAGPAGYERSTLTPEEFADAKAREVAGKLSGRWRIAVWGTQGVGQPPVATIEGGEG